jgi:ubiquinone/menaquinone biosynthesis C-methylase UbiE
MTDTNTTMEAPNHHGDHPGFRGVGGLVAAVSFLLGRSDDARLACELAAIGAGDRVVDVGCGAGVAVRAARRAGAQATGVDPAPAMLRVARLTSARPTTTSAAATWTEGVAEALPVDDGAATVVWSIATVHHWQDVDLGLAEAYRVLAPGGRFLAIERRRRPGSTGHASHGWTDAQADAFGAACVDAGFGDVVVERRDVRRGVLLCVRAVRR